METALGDPDNGYAVIMVEFLRMSANKGHGLYVGLPTMATANAMYKRLAAAYRALFADDTHANFRQQRFFARICKPGMALAGRIAIVTSVIFHHSSWRTVGEKCRTPSDTQSGNQQGVRWKITLVTIIQ
jgi:hypothetical protein